MFHGAMSASDIGLPNFASTLVCVCATDWVWGPAQPIIASAAATPATTASDRILPLPARADGPRENAIVVLHESDDGADFLDVLNRRLNVTGAVEGATWDISRPRAPVS